jgi:hypothetical protein
MTSDRHLALMALMNEITAPAKTYDNCLRRAAAASSISPQYDAAVERGNAALDDIEQAVRRWVAAHPEPSTLPDGFKRHTCVTVACAACGYRYDEAEFVMHFPSEADARNGANGDAWDELADGRVLCMRGDEKHDELRRTVGLADPNDDPDA